MIYERRHDHRRLHQIAFERVIVHIHVGVVRAREIIDRILNELKTGQPHRIERQMIGAAGVADGHGGGAEIVERSQPGLENRPHGVVALQIHAADPTGAVIEIEIGGKQFVFRFQLHGLAVGEMLFHIASRAEQSLLFAAPQRHPDGPARLHTDRLQNAHRFHDYGRAGCIVSRTGAGVPGIEMRPQHDDLFPELFIRARDFGDDVVAEGIILEKLRFDLNSQFDRNVLFQ